MTVRNLDRLLAPRSVALVGASARPGSLGTVILERLVGAGFAGPIGLVNPKYEAIGERACVATVAELPFVPDLGVIATPAETVPVVVAELAAKGAKAAVVIASGVTGALRQAMLEAARPALLRILGPNGIGLQVPAVGLDASFAHLTGRRGNIALLSQSGAIVTAMLDWAEARGVGFSLVASMGDMADVDVGDLLDHLATDRETRAILMYLEGVTHARKFMSAARAAARGKPVIAIKAGRSASAAKAAAWHTGAVAGADDVYDAAFARAGILRVADLQELFDAAEALSRHRPLAGGRLAILTNGGGAGVLAVDALEGTSGRLADISAATLTRLGAATGDNPVDIGGDAGPERYAAAMTALLEAPETDAVLVLNCPTGLASSAAAADAVVGAVQGASRRKPVFASWLGGASAAAAARRLEGAGMATYATPGRAVRAFDELVRYRKAQVQLTRTPPSLPPGPEPDRAAVDAVIAAALGEGRTTLSEVEAKRVLAAYGVPVVRSEVAADPDAAAALAETMLRDDPLLALKILSPDITHKSEVGGVALNLASAAAVRDAATAMLERVAARRPDARIRGVVVQRMVRRTDAHELIIGMADDPTFGPVIVFGAGGTSVEVVADRALALPPLDPLLADGMIAGTRIGRLLRGFRERPAADLAAITTTLCKVSQLVADRPDIVELDINPLLADTSGVIVLDARIRVAPAEPVAPGGNPRFAIRPYPSALDRIEALRSGPVRIRPLRPDDEALYPAFLARVSREDLARRFFGVVGDVSHEWIARLTQIDYAREMAFIALDDAGEMLGVSRYSADPDRRAAEFAVLVRSDLQGRGIGRALMTRLIATARAEGIGTIVGEVLAANGHMLAMMRDLGFEIAAHPDDFTLREVRYPLTV